MDSYIYIVGKPAPGTNALRAIREAGYKVGIFLDTQKTLKRPAEYDRIIPVDFSDLAGAIQQLDAGPKLSVSGVLSTYENYIVAKAQLGKYFGVPSLSVESAQHCTDKYLMRQAFMQADPAITPQFALVKTKAELLAFTRAVSYPLIIKPTNLVKSLLVMKCASEAELITNFDYAQRSIAQLYQQYNIYDREPQLIVEEFVTGRLCSVAAFVDAAGQAHFCNGVVSLVTAQDIGADDNYLYSRSLFTLPASSITAKLFATAEKGIAALGMKSTPAHVELIYNEQGVKIVEIGARVGGYRPRMYQASYELDLHREEVRSAVGETPQLTGVLKKYSAVYELFPASEGTFAGVHMNDATVAVSEYDYYAVKAKLGQTIGPAKNGYKAAAVVIVTHADELQFSKLCCSVDSLHIQVTT